MGSSPVSPTTKVLVSGPISSRLGVLVRPRPACDVLLQGLELRALPLLENGDATGFDHDLEAIATHSVETGHRRALAQAAQWRATRAMMRGDWQEAERRAREVLDQPCTQEAGDSGTNRPSGVDGDGASKARVRSGIEERDGPGSVGVVAQRVEPEMARNSAGIDCWG